MTVVTDKRIMHIPADAHEIASLTNAALCTLLEDAEKQEHELSFRRHGLHDLMDANSSEGKAHAVALAQEERQLSTRRLELHQRITELRLEKSRRLHGFNARLTIVPTDS